MDPRAMGRVIIPSFSLASCCLQLMAESQANDLLGEDVNDLLAHEAILTNNFQVDDGVAYYSKSTLKFNAGLKSEHVERFKDYADELILPDGSRLAKGMRLKGNVVEVP